MPPSALVRVIVRYPTAAPTSIRIPNVTVVLFTRVGGPTVLSIAMLRVDA